MIGLKKGDVWDVSHNFSIDYVYLVEQGYGSTYTWREQIETGAYNNLLFRSSTTKLAIQLPPNTLYNQRGEDNYTIKVLDTNLRLEVMVKDGNAIGFDEGYLYLQTNNQYQIGYIANGQELKRNSFIFKFKIMK